MLESTASESQRTAGWGFLLGWLLAGAIGWAVGGLVYVTLSSPDVDVYAGMAVGWFVTGVLQWLVLRRHLPRIGTWVLAGVATVVTVGVLAFAVGVINADADAGLVLGTIMAGTVAGFLQWWILRHRVPRAGWWVLASTVGWIAGGFFSGAFDASTMAGWPVIGLGYAAITGLAFVLLSRQPSPSMDAQA